jgi:phosphatidylinositol glycan class W
LQEHVTEYGVHWNFFFTLALLPVFGALGERWSAKISFRSMALLVSLVHQVILIATPLQAYALNDQRPNLLAQNKEGLVSFAGEYMTRRRLTMSGLMFQLNPGYLAIYLLGYDTGLYVLPPDPYYLHRKDKQHTHSKPNIGKLLNVLFSYAVVWWAAYGVLHLVLPAKYDTSRRLVR